MTDFSQNIVNQRFNQVYKYLEENKIIRGKSDIAKELGTYNHVINSILKGKRNITVDQLNKLFKTYNINANFLFGASPVMTDDNEIETHILDDRAYGGRSNITLVPQKALAGYALAHESGEYLDSLQKFSIPGLEGQLIAFEISGDSMVPTITNGDVVICEPLERGEPLRDNTVYVIVTDVVVAKRVQQVKRGNQLSQLRLISDNRDTYQPYLVDLEEIKQILKVKCRLTTYGIS